MESIIKKCLPTYEVVRKIGSGVYGTVYLVKDNLKERAVKVVPIIIERSLSNRTPDDLDSKISHDFHAVQRYYQKIKGEGVVEIYDFHLVDKQVTQDEAKAYLIILMEYCPENLLSRIIDNYPLDSKEATRLMIELARVLRRISYRAKDPFIVKDLKPSNLLITNSNSLVIGDLGGLQRLRSMSTSTSAQFTPNWSAPEMITHSSEAGIASLVFSYGFVSYFIWFGTLPYEEVDFTERLRLINEQGIEFNREDIPLNIQILISQCLHLTPKERPPDFNEILRIFDEYMQSESDGAREYVQTEEASTNIRKPVKKNKRTSEGKSRKTSRQRKPDAGVKSAAIDRSPVPRLRSTGPHQIGDQWVEPVTGIELLWVPTGKFEMGCGFWDGEGNKDEFPIHEVHIDGFWLGKYPVTQNQWKQVMAYSFWQKVKKNNPSCFRLGDDYPVEQVSWYDAQDFVQKLTAMNKNRYHFRLPTEAEWEYASRSGGKHEKYPGGHPIDDVAWYSANSKMSSHPVGTRLPNGLGLYDMAGNVYEWCTDFYVEDAYRSHEPDNPINGKETSRRVIRGGSWCNFSAELRCAYRGSVQPEFKGNYLGMRLVMTPMSRRRQTR